MSDEIRSTNETTATGSLVQNIILVTVIAGVAAAVWFGFAPRPTTSASGPVPIKVEGLTTSLAGLPTKGSPAAKIVVIEFSDFQCPFCAQFALGAQQELVAKYVDVGTVAWAFRHLPLSQIHPHAVKAAEAAECAARQGRFWEAHDTLFLEQEELASTPPSALLQRVVGDTTAVAACVENGRARERIVADAKEAARLGFRTTPMFVLGTRQPDGMVRIATALAGARSAAEFGRVLDALVAQ